MNVYIDNTLLNADYVTGLLEEINKSHGVLTEDQENRIVSGLELALVSGLDLYCPMELSGEEIGWIGCYPSGENEEEAYFPVYFSIERLKDDFGREGEYPIACIQISELIRVLKNLNKRGVKGIYIEPCDNGYLPYETEEIEEMYETFKIIDEKYGSDENVNMI